MKNDGENFYWFTVKNTFPRNILFCIAYIPPEGSAYGNFKAFSVKVDTMSSRNDVTKAEICGLAIEYSSFLLHATESSGMLKQVKIFPVTNNAEKHHVVKRPWFNDECRTLRNQYKHALNRRRRTDTFENYKYLTNASRAYKRGYS